MAGEHDATKWKCIDMGAYNHTLHHVFSAQHTCTTDFCLKMWYDFIEKKKWFSFCRTFRDKY